jgi:hypothetical protein
VAKAWAISGVSERTREAVTAAAQEAGMPVGAWVEQALGKALEEGLEPGVSLEEIEARLRQVVADAVQPVQQALLRLPTEAPSSPVSLVRTRMRQRPGPTHEIYAINAQGVVREGRGVTPAGSMHLRLPN